MRRRLPGWLAAALAGAALALSLNDRIDARREAAAPQRVERRLLVFGIDGATWDVIDPLLDAGRLPNLARLLREGSRARLRTLRPTQSPRIWTTIATGVLPERHGILGFVVRIPGTDRRTLPSSTQRRAAALWNVFSAAGHRVGVVNWWATYPAERVSGYVISDRASQVRRATYRSVLALSDETLEVAGDGATHPPALQRELDTILGPPGEPDPERLRRLAPLPPAWQDELRAQRVFARENRLSVLKFALLQDLAAAEASLYALRRYEPDVLLHFLSGVDAIEHHFWKYREPERFQNVPADELAVYGGLIDRYYELADEILGRFLAAYADDPFAVIVVSDHGHEADPRHGTPEARGQAVWASGTHENAPDGILVLSGDDAAPAPALGEASVLDVAPTALALMGVPVGADMPGRVWREAIDAEFLAAHPVRFVAKHPRPRQGRPEAPVASEADAEIEGRLRALGYVE